MMMTATDCRKFDNESKNSILKYSQVRRLDSILNETFVICGDNRLPIICVTVKDFILAVKHKLELYQFPMVDMRLNGGGAAAVLDPLNLYKYNDIDILIILDSTQISDGESYFNDTIKAVIDVIRDLLQPMSETTLNTFESHKLSYIHKLVRIQNTVNGDNWSLLGLGANGQFGYRFRRIDLKFTHRMKRQFEFSIDSFQIVLDSLLIFYEALRKFSSSVVCTNKNFYPTVSVISKWPSLTEALNHLSKRYIVTSQPEHIRGGGLLKYCKLLVQNFTVPDPLKISKLERYMCSRFFIDYIDLKAQHKAIYSYLKNHFHLDEAQVFLDTLKRVISDSSICLMSHERQQTLYLIDQIYMEINSPFNMYSVKSFDNWKSDFSGFSESEWSIDTVIDGVIVSDQVELSACQCRSYSNISSHWSTPFDMSPIDMPD